ncbi:hypothetical protein ABW21_db0201979 [Orbilia brochopaga]|nr:hypothetical protein ABW21_db0201979 [Drechslerella brochopaga]
MSKVRGDDGFNFDDRIHHLFITDRFGTQGPGNRSLNACGRTSIGRIIRISHVDVVVDLDILRWRILFLDDRKLFFESILLLLALRPEPSEYSHFAAGWKRIWCGADRNIDFCLHPTIHVRCLGSSPLCRSVDLHSPDALSRMTYIWKRRRLTGGDS